MINVCLENSEMCESFETVEEAIKFLEKNKTINVGDTVKVIDTGKVYSRISKESISDIFHSLSYGVMDSLDIIYNMNKDGLGYTEGITSIDYANFKVVCKFDNDNKLLIKPIDHLITFGGYYVIAVKGVKKVG